MVVYDQEDPKAYDAIFPDWFTIQRCDTIPGGVLTIFPMCHPSRRLERSPKIIEDLKKTCKHFIDLTYLEKDNQFIEGKGSVIYDLRNNKIYCCNSSRATLPAIEAYVKELTKISTKPWRAVIFTGTDDERKVIYHTDCMLQLLDKHVLLCADSLPKDKRDEVVDELTNPAKNVHPYKVVEISFAEVKHMCCNILNVVNKKGENVLLMSKQAFDNYTEEHMKTLKENYKLVPSDVTTIEQLGGGSTRCLLAEYF